MPRRGSALGELGRRWLGVDAETGEILFPARPELVAPRRYGFHATLKAPFRLAQGIRVDDLVRRAGAFAARTLPVTAGPLKLDTLGRFLALVPSERSDGLTALAWDCVREFDSLRAPMTEGDLARRPALSPADRDRLVRWGYPWVGDAFRFHMTLTSSLEADGIETSRTAIGPLVAPLAAHPLEIDDLCICGDPGPGRMFTVLERIPLSGAPAPRRTA